MFEIGNTLREARTRQGLDLRECEDATKIRGKYLLALEEENFEALPSPAYVRGFLRTYAEFLDLDGRLVLDEYDHRFGGVPGESTEESRLLAPRRPRPRGESRERRRGRKRRRSEAQLLWLAIGGVTAVALLVWLGIGQNDSAPPVVPSTTEAEGPEVLPTPAPEPPEDTDQETAELVAISLQATPGTEGSWIQVRGRNSTGPVLFEGTLPAGETRSWNVGRSVWLRAGNAASLTVLVDGSPVVLDELTGNYVVSRSGARLVSTG
jgi:cytoskeletal protein RodZ